MATPSTDADSETARSEPDPQSYRTPLLYPHRYFERYDRPSLTIGALIVVLETVATIVGVYLFVQEVAGRLDISAVARSQFESEAINQLLPLFFVVLLGWLILAGIFHLFVWFADGHGGFGTTLAIVGEAELAALVLMPVTIVLLLQTATGVPSDPSAAVEYFQRAAGMNTPGLFVVGLVGQVWASIITGVGLAIAHDLKTGRMLALALAVGLGFYLFF